MSVCLSLFFILPKKKRGCKCILKNVLKKEKIFGSVAKGNTTYFFRPYCNISRTKLVKISSMKMSRFAILLSIQVISYLHTIMTNPDLKVKTCLVVAPLNTVLNWEDEFEKWIGHMDSGINVSIGIRI